MPSILVLLNHSHYSLYLGEKKSAETTKSKGWRQKRKGAGGD